jgi:hypothetical protein
VQTVHGDPTPARTRGGGPARPGASLAHNRGDGQGAMGLGLPGSAGPGPARSPPTR